MAKVMVTLELEPEQANLDEVRRLLGLGGHELDANFGVVNISPKDHLLRRGLFGRFPTPFEMARAYRRWIS